MELLLAMPREGAFGSLALVLLTIRGHVTANATSHGYDIFRSKQDSQDETQRHTAVAVPQKHKDSREALKTILEACSVTAQDHLVLVQGTPFSSSLARWESFARSLAESQGRLHLRGMETRGGHRLCACSFSCSTSDQLAEWM
ncbi:Proline Dehydrogenase 1 [Manis pentadactyla]|nr:Proline Dehydrogenase 1 [Manis pentadactyla]